MANRSKKPTLREQLETLIEQVRRLEKRVADLERRPPPQAPPWPTAPCPPFVPGPVYPQPPQPTPWRPGRPGRYTYSAVPTIVPPTFTLTQTTIPQAVGLHIKQHRLNTQENEQ